MKSPSFPPLIRGISRLLILLIPGFWIWSLPATSEEKKVSADPTFVPLFNGKDLTGWVNVNCAPSTFFVKNNEIITNGKPTGFLRTARQYENFIAEFDWMHVNTKDVGNSGFFVWADPIPAVGTGYTRGIEVQVLVNLEKPDHYTSHGDLFSIWGATCKPDRPHPQGWARCLPSERRCKGGGEWNHYKVTANNGSIKLEVNGKEVSGIHDASPRKGYLALESEGAECHFRNLMIKELPSTNPAPQEIADEDRNFKSLYNGIDLTGWKGVSAGQERWQSRDNELSFIGKGLALDASLRTEGVLEDHETIVDFRFPSSRAGTVVVGLRETGDDFVRLSITPDGSLALESRAGDQGDKQKGTFSGLKKPGQWNRLETKLRGKDLTVRLNGQSALTMTLSAAPASGVLVLRPTEAMDFTNLFLRRLK